MSATLYLLLFDHHDEPEGAARCGCELYECCPACCEGNHAAHVAAFDAAMAADQREDEDAAA